MSWALLRVVRTSIRLTSVRDLKLGILRDDEALCDVLVLSFALYPTLAFPLLRSLCLIVVCSLRVCTLVLTAASPPPLVASFSAHRHCLSLSICSSTHLPPPPLLLVIISVRAVMFVFALLRPRNLVDCCVYPTILGLLGLHCASPPPEIDRR